ncbi:MAG: valine--tRNA ligase, partial [Alphaproteobacteria bacterium]
SEVTRGRVARHGEPIRRLARLSEIQMDAEPQSGSVQTVVDEATVALPLADVVDLDQERARLTREIERLSGDIDKLDEKLANENFTGKAPAEVVEEQRERRTAAATARDRLRSALDRLSAA